MKKVRRWQVIVLIILAAILGTLTICYFQMRGTAFPKKDKIKVNEIGKSYMIEGENYMDYQFYNDCSGYAIAYVLRSMGVSTNGKKVYEEIPKKNADGSVTLDQVVKYFKRNGYHATLFTGSLETLKARVKKGVPVIVFIRSVKGRDIYHYSTVVGYDEEYLYLADSVMAFCNERELHYNRKITNEEFKELWKINNFGSDNMYIVVDN